MLDKELSGGAIVDEVVKTVKSKTQVFVPAGVFFDIFSCLNLKKGNDQELIQSHPRSHPQNQ